MKISKTFFRCGTTILTVETDDGDPIKNFVFSNNCNAKAALRMLEMFLQIHNSELPEVYRREFETKK